MNIRHMTTLSLNVQITYILVIVLRFRHILYYYMY